MGPSLHCTPELVTGFVDGELGHLLQNTVALHITACAACAAQAAAERYVHARLRALQPVLPQAESLPN